MERALAQPGDRISIVFCGQTDDEQLLVISQPSFRL